MTITEGLAEIKTLEKRIAHKMAAVIPYVARPAALVDPLAGKGGSQKYITGEMQSIRDLQSRIVHIRTAIQATNLRTKLIVGGWEQTIAEWLTWRKEVSANQRLLLTNIRSQISRARGEGAPSPARKAVAEASGVASDQTNVFVDEAAIIAASEALEETLGVLDGRLSLLNATVPLEGIS